MDGDAAVTEQLGQAGLNILTGQVVSHTDRQALPGTLVKYVQGAKAFPIVGAVHLDVNSNWIIYTYVTWPIYIFLGIYLGLSIVMLFFGYGKAARIKKESLNAIMADLPVSNTGSQ